MQSGVVGQTGRDQTHQGLAAVGSGHQPGGAVQRSAEEVSVPLFRLSGVDADPEAEPPYFRQRLVGEPTLDVSGGLQGIARRVEHGADAVSGVLEDPSTMFFHQVFEEPIVDSQSLPHRLGVLLPQPGRSLQVGEQKRDHTHPLGTVARGPRGRRAGDVEEADEAVWPMRHLEGW